MTIIKKDISKEVSKKIGVSEKDGEVLLNKFLLLVKNKSKNNVIVKLSKFGSFQRKLTPERLGRNPKTGAVFVINSFKRLSFRPSFGLKKIIN
tara:strand:+ start:573 stop:851 length:279 start_codon:yes stop_codon:yes gene_type:complete